MSLNRRQALTGSAAILVSAWRNVAAESEVLAALKASPLIYLSPLVSDGRESRCHAEVWFVHRHGEIFVYTWADKWRARAMRRGFNRARVWVGDFGVWTRAKERYRSAPQLTIDGRFETDAAVQEALLGDFASKYESQWTVWDPTIRAGLASGAWVLLRYQILNTGAQS